MNRREFLRITAVSAAGMALPIRYVVGEDQIASPPGEVDPASFLTPNQEFYIQHIRGTPKLVADTWKLAITGRVKQMTVLTYKQLREMPAVEKVQTLSCIGDPLGGPQIGNAVWKGVPVRAVLERAGIRPGVKKVVFRCADGYHTGVPLEDVLHEDALLAYEMNGEPLPAEHGYPIRFVNPGHYGQKCPKWILNLDLTEKDYLGYWESRGWSDEARVKMATRINQPQDGEVLEGTRIVISGSAYDGGNHGGIARVEVSLDDGATWQPATIWASGPPLAWALWYFEWALPQDAAKKRWSILARSVARDGTVQPNVSADAYPAGAEGYHRVVVKLRG